MPLSPPAIHPHIHSTNPSHMWRWPLQVKLWDVSGAAPKQLAAEDLKVGSVFAASFCGDAPMLLAAGGSKGSVSVWDTATNAAVAAFAQQQQGAAAGEG
jgi:hypothetical protein